MNEIITRSASVRPNSFDTATGTFEALIATASPVARRGYHEILDPSGARLPDKAPLVLDHRTDVRSRVGTASNLKAGSDGITCFARVSADQSLDWLRSRIADGALDVSVAYTVDEWQEGRDANGNRTRTAKRWSLRHVSLVAEPADTHTGIRSADNDDEPYESTNRIRSLCAWLNLPHDIERRAIDEQWTDQEIRAHVHQRSPIIRTVTNGLDNPDVYRRAAVDALVARMGGSEAQGPARELAGLSWAEMHRRHLRQAGHSVAGLSDQEVIVRALGTSDMPIIAGAAVNVRIRRTYDAAVSPLSVVFGTRELPDFRPMKDALVDWTPLAVGRVNELAEFKTSYVTESGESYSLFTIGGITNVSRQLYINGASALGNLSEAQGRRLAADVSDRMVAYLTQNTLAGPAMSDNGNVFSAAPGGRGNVLDLDDSDIAEIIESVLTARAAMPKRVGAANVMIGQFPRYWVVPAEFEGSAVRALATINPTSSADVNPLTGRLEVIPEPRLTSATTSYLVCSPDKLEGAVKVNLSGAPGPTTESRWGFEVDAVQFKIRLDIGFGWLDWRSWTRLDHSHTP